MLNKKALRCISMALVTIMALVALVACGGSGGNLVARWEGVSYEEKWGDDSPRTVSLDGTGVFFEFLSDGTGTSRYDGWPSNFTYTTESGRVRIVSGSVNSELSYRVSGSTLTLTYESGTYTRITTLRKAN